MRPYWEFAKRSFRRGMAYRVPTLLRIVGNVVVVLIQVTIWRALLGHGAVLPPEANWVAPLVGSALLLLAYAAFTHGVARYQGAGG